MEMNVLGLHHITLGCSDAQRTIDFYTGVLGLRFIKLTVNFDDPFTYHLYFGDELGRPGTAITFFEWPGVQRGHPGIGGTHHFSLQVAEHDGLLKWKGRLTDLGFKVNGPTDYTTFAGIIFGDPDGTLIEIATRGPGWEVGKAFEAQEGRDQTWPNAVPEITQDMALTQGMHHITTISSDLQRTHAFYEGLLGMRRIMMTSDLDSLGSDHWIWGAGDGEPGNLIMSFERDPATEPRASIGVGQTHHFALAVPDEDAQLNWREKLIQAGLQVTPVMDRLYFKSIYTRGPDGHIVELATMGPGFAVDEEPEHLGTKLMLPPWYESQREQIKAGLRPVRVPIQEKRNAEG
jgi:glyoxalase family protein